MREFGVQSLSWAAVWRRRVWRHRLGVAAPRARMTEVVGRVCGIHAQMMSSAELSLGLRVADITRADFTSALWPERTLVKTYGLRGTLHVFPSSEVQLWLAALRARPSPGRPSAQRLAALGEAQCA